MMRFYVTSRKEWVQNPDRPLGGWWKKHYVVVRESHEVRTHADSGRESFFSAEEIAAKMFPEFFNDSFDTRVYSGMVGGSDAPTPYDP